MIPKCSKKGSKINQYLFLGFDPFAETQKALAELMRDEVTRNKVEEPDHHTKRHNTVNAPPGFSSLSSCKY